jgi:RNA polymerase sigma-70 factor, ECF subfamily
MVVEAERLAAALGRREEAALGELYDRYGGTVYALALRMTGDQGMAQEIALDAFMQVWQQVDRFDARQGSLEGWLFTIARSRAIDRLRAVKAAKRTLGEEQEQEPLQPTRVDPPEEIVELVERQRHVRRALGLLTPAQRAALDLAYFQGLSHSEIAEQLGEPLGTVKTRIRQAMLLLRKVLSPVLANP